MRWLWLEQRTARVEAGTPYKLPIPTLEVSDVAIKHAPSIPTPLFNQGKMALFDAIPRPIHRVHEEAVIVDDAVAESK